MKTANRPLNCVRVVVMNSLVLTALVLGNSSSIHAQASLVCPCTDGILNCSASGLSPNTQVFLNIDLTEYSFGFNGVGDAFTDANGSVDFPSFDVFSYLEERDLTLDSVIMAVTNMPGEVLVQANVPTCTPRPVPAISHRGKMALVLLLTITTTILLWRRHSAA